MHVAVILAHLYIPFHAFEIINRNSHIFFSKLKFLQVVCICKWRKYVYIFSLYFSAKKTNKPGFIEDSPSS